MTAVQVYAMLAGPLRIDVVGLTVEGDRAAIECRSSAPLPDGTNYENRYHYLFIVRDGLVVEVREFLDSAYLFRTRQRLGLDDQLAHPAPLFGRSADQQ